MKTLTKIHTFLLAAFNEYSYLLLDRNPPAKIVLGVNTNRIAELFNYTPTTITTAIFAVTLYRNKSKLTTLTALTGLALLTISFLDLNFYGEFYKYISIFPLSICLPHLAETDPENRWLWITTTILLMAPYFIRVFLL